MNLPNDIPIPGKSSTQRAIAAAEELPDVSKYGYFKSIVNNMGNPILDVSKELADIFNATTEESVNPKINLKEVHLPKVDYPVPLPRVTRAQPPQLTTLPSPKVVMTKERDQNLGTPHVIPDDQGIYPSINRNTQLSQKGPYMILDGDEYDETTRYIHKYNTRSVPTYDFVAAIL